MFVKSKFFLLSLILGSTSLGIAGASLAATTHDHSQAEGVHALQLKAGERWATDAPLRKAMGALMLQNLEAHFDGRPLPTPVS